MKGIDVSENNGEINWDAVVDEGYEFAIIRLGYGNRHLDEMFYDNVNKAKDAGLKIGVYYYDYGLCTEDALRQADYMLDVLDDCGLTPSELGMGVWYDMEDADAWKAKNGMPGTGTITAMCSTFINKCRQYGYDCGLYACLDWLMHKISVDELPAGTPIWLAEYGDDCDFDCDMWQYTDAAEIDGRNFDANEYFGI